MTGRTIILLIFFAMVYGAPRLLSGTENTAEQPADAETVAHEIMLAEAARQLAADAGAEWLETGALIEQARQEAEKENWPQAMVMANRARRQGELAVEQAERESAAWRERVIQ
jgi:hypothetical protein